MTTTLAKDVVLLFFEDYESDKFFKGDRYLKRLIRPIYDLLHHRKKTTGFRVWFELLCAALTGAGYTVRVNDYRAARKNPGHPVGLVGYPVLIDRWTLQNPAILGPALYDHAQLAPNLMAQPGFEKYVVVAPWTRALYEPTYGDVCVEWFAGIDVAEWPDQSKSQKTFDFLVYDKIRWDHDAYASSLLEPILASLVRRGLTYQLVRYGDHDRARFKSFLRDCSALLFLCEHETQGLAYQEAMASGLPVLAWDRGYWADPLWRRFMAEAPIASSVPFFSEKCGETFSGIDTFDAKLDTFLARKSSYDPRGYVSDTLTFAASASLYADQYFALLK